MSDGAEEEEGEADDDVEEGESERLVRELVERDGGGGCDGDI